MELNSRDCGCVDNIHAPSNVKPGLINPYAVELGGYHLSIRLWLLEESRPINKPWFINPGLILVTRKKQSWQYNGSSTGSVFFKIPQRYRMGHPVEIILFPLKNTHFPNLIRDLFQIETSWNMLKSILPRMEFLWISSLIIIFRRSPPFYPIFPSPTAPKRFRLRTWSQTGLRNHHKWHALHRHGWELSTRHCRHAQARPVRYGQSKRKKGRQLVTNLVTQLVISEMWIFVSGNHHFEHVESVNDQTCHDMSWFQHANCAKLCEDLKIWSSKMLRQVIKRL